MQKKLIALAVAGLVAAPAFAQSNVTVYGRIDMGFMNQRGDAGTKSSIESGMLAPNYLGFKGVEDLGNGLKVGFDFQTRLNTDRNEQRDQLTSGSRRDAFLFVSGAFGTVKAGRLTTPQDDLLGTIDPMQSSAIAGYGLTWNNTFAGLATGAAVIPDATHVPTVAVPFKASLQNVNATDNTRWDNSVAYVSPSFSGLKVTAVYSREINGNEGANGSSNARAWSLAPVYENGPLLVGLTYSRVQERIAANNIDVAGTDISANMNESQWDLAGAYDFGVAKLAAAYGRSKTDFGSVLGDLTISQWLVGATVPVSAAGKVAAVYGRQKSKDIDDSQTSRWALAYYHSLSKRTTAYAQFGSIDYDANSVDGNVTVGGAASNGLATQDYTRTYGVGLQHKF